MGTRNLTCVVNDGTYRIAQYGQWDGYPSGQGLNILGFLSDGNVEALKRNSLKCSFISDENYKRLWREFGVNLDKNGFVDSKTSDKFNAKYPQFNRDVGSDILKMVADSPDGLMLQDDYMFAADSLFCEWAYVIDFDKNTFEIYQGFNNKPLDSSERFSGLYCKANDKRDSDDKYYPVKLVATFSLSELPDTEEFLLECEPPDEEGEAVG